jgi:alpha-beta hydrolase superfamily lysophospholipase
MRGGVRILRRVGIWLAWGVLGFFAGALVIHVSMLRRGPPLELWHTEALTAEFTVDRSDEILRFEDYLRLEEELAVQIDEQIYAHTDRGPSFELVRYSTGSLADPREHPTDWNRTFELQHDAPAGGVLLLHGMSDSPYSLRALGEVLHRRGYWVIGLRLPGHGTAPSGLATARWEDMALAARLAIARLTAKAGPDAIHIAGYSTGAALAVDYALDALEGKVSPVPASLVLISPAIGITPAAALAQWKLWLARLPGLGKLAWSQILPEFDPFKYNSFTTNAGVQVHRLTRSIGRRIEARAAGAPIEGFPPTVAFLSSVDATVSTDAVVDVLFEHLAPGDHELVLFDVNRYSVKSTLMVRDPGPLTARLLANPTLPFGLTLITNESSRSRALVSRRKPPLSSDVEVEPLGLTWPASMLSLSHIALPFPPEDPLYGAGPPAADGALFLGQTPIQGERGLLLFPTDWLLRLRHNPFYELLESKTTAWVDRRAGGHSPDGVSAPSP